MRKKVPTYRHHKPSGRAVCTINSRDWYLGDYGTRQSKQAYSRLIEEWEATGRSTSFGIGQAETTVAMIAADYLDHCKVYYPDRYNSETATARKAIEYLTDYLGTAASEFGPLRLKAVRQSMLEAKNQRTGNPQSRVYVNRLISHICRMFRWAAENELVSITVHQALANVPGLKRGRCDAPETDAVRPVDDSMVQATLPHCTQVVGDMIKTQRLTGMRPAEVCCLTPRMIDRTGPTWIATLPVHKSAWRGIDRSIFIGPKAQQILLKYLLRSDSAALFSPAESEFQRRERMRESRVTPNSCGNGPGTNRKQNPILQASEAYDTNSYRRAIKYACAKAFPAPRGASEKQAEEWKAAHSWAPNQLRHAMATQTRREHGLEAAQVLLGHATADVTQIYAETDKQKAMQVAQMIG